MSPAEAHISFEFFPPKTQKGKIKLKHTAAELAKVSPHYFSVTYGAGGTIRDGTLETVNSIKKTTSTAVAPHLTCIGANCTELIKILKEYKASGFKRIVALRGDLPSYMPQEDELNFAYDLVTLIRKTTGDHFHIDVAAYPEFHPQAETTKSDLLNLKRKADAGANSAITQYFYNPDAYFYFLDQCEKYGITIPITPGIMPITNYERLQRFSTLCGAEIPQWMRRRFEDYDDDPESIQLLGLEVVYELCDRLVKGGAPGLHFYTLNQAEASLALVKMLNFTTPSHLKLSELA